MIGSSPWGAGVQILATRWFTHTDCPLLLPRGWWHQQMEVSECGDPQRSIDTVCFNNPTRDGEMKTLPHFLFRLIPLLQILGEKKKKDSYEIATRASFWGRGERNGMHADLVSISTNIPYMIIFACTFNLLSIHIQIPDHIISFPSIPGSLSQPLPSQAVCSHFNVNSVSVYLPLNPPPSFSTAFPQIPEKLIRETCVCLWGLPHNMSVATS